MKRIELKNGGFVMVDDEDFERVRQITWSWFQPKKNYSKQYVRGRTDGKQVFLHRYILNAPQGMLVDHRDGNPFNNCRSNLRLATYQQNIFNSDTRCDSVLKIKGVKKEGKRFSANITHSGNKYRIGLFDTIEEAKAAYDAKSAELYGEFAFVNSRPLQTSVPTAA